MESPNGNKLIGGRGMVKSSRPAGMVVAQSHHALRGCWWRRLVSAVVMMEFPHQCLFGGWRWLLVWVAVCVGGGLVVRAGMQGNVGLIGRQ